MRSPESVRINGAGAGHAWPYTSNPDDPARVWLSLRRAHDDGRVLWDPIRDTRTAGCWDDHGEEYPQGKGPNLYIDLPIPDGVFLLSLYFFEIDWQQYRAHRIELYGKATSGATEPRGNTRKEKDEERFGTQISADERGYGREAPGDKGPPTDRTVKGPPSVGVPLSVGEIRCRPAAVQASLASRREFAGTTGSLAHPLTRLLAHTSVDNYFHGKYKRFAVQGPVDLTIRITREQSVNAIVSGIFLDKLAYPDDCPWPRALVATEAQRPQRTASDWSQAAESALAAFERSGRESAGQLAQSYIAAEWAYFGALREAEAKSPEGYYRHLTANYPGALERLRRFQAKADFSAEYVTAQGLIHRAHHALLDWPRAKESLVEWGDLITTLVTTERNGDADAASRRASPVRRERGSRRVAQASSLPPAQTAGDSAPNLASTCPTCPKSHSPPTAPVVNPPGRVFDHEPSTINHAVASLRRLAAMSVDAAGMKATPILPGFRPTRERSERWQLASHLAENFAVLATANLAPDVALPEAHRFAQTARAKACPWLGIIALEHLLYRSPSP
ncbi:MAG: hypothetical protein FJ279_35495, partial [Planctomycetes bacterium]|nr:hypothetical protein [Planctomycetota bacterium]